MLKLFDIACGTVVIQSPTPFVINNMAQKAKKNLPKIDITSKIAVDTEKDSGVVLESGPAPDITPSSSSDSLTTGKPSRRPRPQPINLSMAQMTQLKTNFQSPVKEQFKADTIPQLDATKDLNDAELETLEELGEGSGGTVFRVSHKKTKMIMAKKVITTMDTRLSKEIVRELQILHKCNSPDIVSFYGAFTAANGEICVCMEYMDVGSLEKVYKVSGKLTEPILVKVAVSVLRGLTYLFEKHKIIHRDIKPSNILINSQGSIKICDFGVSGQLETTLANTFVGTGAYMSPERIKGSKYAVQCDVWSLGMSLIEMAIGKYPFASDDADDSDEPLQLSVFELIQHIVNGPVPTLPENSGFSELFRGFIAQCLVKDPDSRQTPMKMLRSHPIVSYADTIKLDMARWASSFLHPNLSENQKHRLSVTMKQKRNSVMLNKEKRQSVVRGMESLKLEARENNNAPLSTIPASPPQIRKAK